MKKIITIVTLAMMLTLVACAGKNEVATNVDSAVGTQGIYPISINDQNGRTVQFESKPERIISPYYITNSMLISLGLADEMVGIEDSPEKRNIYGMSAKSLLDLPTVGTAKNLDLEVVASLNPDLVILPMKLKDISANLDELGITNIIVNPESDELLADMISLVGEITDTSDRANELNEYIASHTEALIEKNKSVTCPTVYLSGNSDFLLTSGEAMYQSSMIRIAGGKNVASEIEDTYWAEVDYEQILAWNPEYIVIASAATYSVEDVLNDANLSMCDAVKNKNVYKIPGDIEAWDSPVPGAFLASIWLESILHPENVSEEEYESTVKEFYERFYGVTE